MEHIKENVNEPVELKDDELEKVAGGSGHEVRYQCFNTPKCGRVFTVSRPDGDNIKYCPYCGSTNIKKNSHQP